MSRDEIERLVVLGQPVSLNGRDLSGLDLSGLQLRRADFSYAVLNEANLSGADLRGAFLWAVQGKKLNLRGADLRGAQLGTADLSGADARGADTRGANLMGTNLRGADLRGADLRDAALINAILESVVQDEETRWPKAKPQEYPRMADIALGTADNGRTVRVQPGHTITVRLPENPTTGFRWQAVILEDVLEQVSSRYTPSRGDAAGAGGEREIVFAVRGVGESRFRLLYKQPWLSHENAAETFEVLVVSAP